MTHKEVRPERKIASLLRSKNRCLERFLALSSGFLASPDSFGLTPSALTGTQAPSALDALEAFESSRAKLVHALRLFDHKIAEAISALPRPAQGETWLADARQLLKQGDATIARILELDRQVLERVESAKSALMKEINHSRKSRELVGKFKSEWIPQSGEGLDSKL